MLLGLGAAALLGCTQEPGHGFATLGSAGLAVELVPEPGRLLGNRTLRSDLAYRLELETATLDVAHVSLEERAEAGGGGAFDPAAPPPGYTLCHNDHCHSVDGRLVSYAEIEAELAGGGQVSWLTLLSMPIDEPFDLWDGRKQAVTRFEPSDELPRAAIGRASVKLERLEFRGWIAGGPEPGLGDASIPLHIELGLERAVQAPVELVIDEDGAGTLSLDLRLELSARIFDGIDFAAQLSRGAVTIKAADDESAVKLAENVLASELHVTF